MQFDNRNLTVKRSLQRLLNIFYTVDNFYYRIANGAEKNTGTQSLPGDRTYVKFTAPSFSYNATTGVLTAGNGTAYGYAGQPAAPATVSSSIAITSTKYCIYLK